MNARQAQRVASAVEAARYAETRGTAKRWFILNENPHSGLRLGIAMFNPDIYRIADMCYASEPSVMDWERAWLIVHAVNACVEVNPQNPQAAAEAYPRLIHACQNALALEMADAGGYPVVRTVVDIVREALEEVRKPKPEEAP